MPRSMSIIALSMASEFEKGNSSLVLNGMLMTWSYCIRAGLYFSPGFRRVCRPCHWQVPVHPVPQVPGNMLVLPFLRLCLLLRPGGDSDRAPQETDPPTSGHRGVDGHQHRLCHSHWPAAKRAAPLNPLFPAVMGVPRPRLWRGQWPSALLVPAVPCKWKFRWDGRQFNRHRSAGRPGRRKRSWSLDQAAQGLLPGGQAHGCSDWDVRSPEAPSATAQPWHWLCGFGSVWQLQSEDPQQTGATLPVHLHQRGRGSRHPVIQGSSYIPPAQPFVICFGLESLLFFMDIVIYTCVCVCVRPYPLKWVTVIVFVILRYLGRENKTFFKLIQNLVGIIIIVWNHNHHSISFWEISKSFIIQPLATNGCMCKTSFSNSCKQFLCIRSIISDAKKTGQFDFAENPKSRKMEAPFENKPQWEAGLVSLGLISKGRVTHLCNHVCVIDITLVRVKLQQQSAVNCQLGELKIAVTDQDLTQLIRRAWWILILYIWKISKAIWPGMICLFVL